MDAGNTSEARAGDPVKEEWVNSPKHYVGHPKGIECIDVIEDNPFSNLSSAMRYIWRVSWGGKFDDLEDLKKARWYVDREITRRTTHTINFLTRHPKEDR